MVSAPLPTRSALLHPGPSAKGTAAAAAAARHPPEQQPMCALIAVGGYLKPILQIGALDTNISNLKKKKKGRKKEKRRDKNPIIYISKEYEIVLLKKGNL